MEGACEASLACTTCHCYVEPDEMFDQVVLAFEQHFAHANICNTQMNRITKFDLSAT